MAGNAAGHSVPSVACVQKLAAKYGDRVRGSPFYLFLFYSLRVDSMLTMV